MANLCQSICGFKDCGKKDAAECLDIDRNKMSYAIFSDIVNSVQVSEGQDDIESDNNFANDITY